MSNEQEQQIKKFFKKYNLFIRRIGHTMFGKLTFLAAGLTDQKYEQIVDEALTLKISLL